jgi:MFS family permease
MSVSPINQTVRAGTPETADICSVEARVGDARRWLALPVLLAGAFLPVLDFNVVNLALPVIRRDLGAASSDVQLVISAYAATYAAFLVTGGRLGDWLGRKRMFIRAGHVRVERAGADIWIAGDTVTCIEGKVNV